MEGSQLRPWAKARARISRRQPLDQAPAWIGQSLACPGVQAPATSAKRSASAEIRSSRWVRSPPNAGGVELAASTTTPDPRRPAGPAEPPSRLRASQEGSSTGYVPYDRWLSAACETAATDRLVLVSRSATACVPHDSELPVRLGVSPAIHRSACKRGAAASGGDHGALNDHAVDAQRTRAPDAAMADRADLPAPVRADHSNPAQR